MKKNLSHDSIRVKRKWRSPARITSELCESEREELEIAQPDLHMTGIILCLTLRKSFNPALAKLKKFSFFLIRSLYIESKRPKNLPRHRKHQKSPKTGKLNLILGLNPQHLSNLFQAILVIFSKSFKSNFRSFRKNLKISFLLKSIKTLGLFQKFIFHKRIYFDFLIRFCPDYLKISETYHKCYQLKLISAFE